MIKFAFVVCGHAHDGYGIHFKCIAYKSLLSTKWILLSLGIGWEDVKLKLFPD